MFIFQFYFCLLLGYTLYDNDTLKSIISKCFIISFHLQLWSKPQRFCYKIILISKKIIDTQYIYFHVELASETPTVDSNLEFSVVIYFEMFKDISSSDKLPRPSMSRHTEVGIWRTQIKVKYMYTITNIKLYPGWSSWKWNWKLFFKTNCK